MVFKKLRLLFDEDFVPEILDEAVSEEVEPLFRAIFSKDILKQLALLYSNQRLNLFNTARE